MFFYIFNQALQEAQDIDIHLHPLRAQLPQMEKEGFPHFETFIPALFHTLFLIWTNCQSYQRPARIVVLLKELCNLLIEQVRFFIWNTSISGWHQVTPILNSFERSLTHSNKSPLLLCCYVSLILIILTAIIGCLNKLTDIKSFAFRLLHTFLQIFYSGMTQRKIYKWWGWW